MKTLPERFQILAALALWAAAACAACAAHAEPQPPEMQPSPGATTFFRDRAHPEEVTTDAADVEVRGAVGRPGRLKLAPGVETLDQALRSVGGLLPEAVAVRIHAGENPLRKLFAEAATGPATVDLPVATLASHGVVYLRPGDVVEVVSSEAPVAPPAASEPEQVASDPPAPAAAGASGGDEASAGSPAEPSPSAPPPPAGSAAPPRAGSSEAVDQARALAELRDQITALRGVVEKQNDTLRSQIEELRSEQATLRASLDQVSRPRPAPASLPAAPQRPPAPAPSPAAAPVGAETTPSATVTVSGSVKKPGVYALIDVKTVAGAVSAAGQRDDANLNAVEIRPEDQGSALLGIGLGLGGHPGKRIVDLTAVASGKTADVPLGGGEKIFVPAMRGRSQPMEAVR